MKLLKIKRDALGRRTDKVRKREVKEMRRLKIVEGQTTQEIAANLKRDCRTVVKHLRIYEDEDEHTGQEVQDTASAGQLIQRHVKRDKELIAEKDTTSDPRFMKHLDELAETAKILVHHAGRMLRYKNNDDIETSGNITMVFRFWRKSTSQPVTENIDPLAEFRYLEQHRVDSYLLKGLFAHYEERFGKLPFADWKEVTMGKVDQPLRENLLLLTHSEELSFCPSCPSCKAIKRG